MAAPTPVPKTLDDITLDWLNAILNPHEIQVHEFKFLGDARNGQGYLGALTRLQLQVQQTTSGSTSPEELRLILKSPPSDPNTRAYTITAGYCQNEVQMYTKVLPAINTFLDSQNVSQENRFSFPKCYFGQEEEGETPQDYNFILVLEDLLASNYKLWEEGPAKSFDWNHASIAIKSIACFHAASAAYKISKGFRRYDIEFPKFVKHSTDDPALDNFIAIGFNAAREVMGEELPEGLMERLALLEKQFKPIVQKMMVEIDETALNALRHSDLHFFNVAFAYDLQKNCVACKWFDFQMCSEGKPMLDLAFLLILNCEPQFSTTELDKSLELYHKTFSSVFEGAKIPVELSLETIREQFKLHRLAGILHIISGARVWLFGPNSSEVSRERLRRAVIYAYENGQLELPHYVS